MTLRRDYGEASYQGHGHLHREVALITDGPTGICSRWPLTREGVPPNQLRHDPAHQPAQPAGERQRSERKRRWPGSNRTVHPRVSLRSRRLLLTLNSQ